MLSIFLAVNKNGDEIISNKKLFRYKKELEKIICFDNYQDNNSYKRYSLIEDHWCNTYSKGLYTIPKFDGVILPKGTIYKLTNITLSWEDEPIELNNLI